MTGEPERRIIAAVEDLAGWHPLSVTTLCRAMAAQTVPLSAGCRAFIEHLDTITPGHEATVRRVVRGLVGAGLIDARAVDLSPPPTRDLVNP
jgi:hypothetical protein